MSEIVWKCPAPSSSFNGVQIKIMPRRAIVLWFHYENENGQTCKGELCFSNTVHYKVTYRTAIRADQINEAYDKLIDKTGDSDHATVVAAALENGDTTNYHLYSVCFDDGPHFDIVCESFAYTETEG
jgi:hypothetical protein